MSERPRFTIRLSVTDNYGHESWHHAIGCDEAMSISWRDVEALKDPGPFSVLPMDQTVRMLKTRELRRDVLVEAAKRLAQQMADRLEDSEGWHDPSRVEPARKALKGY